MRYALLAMPRAERRYAQVALPVGLRRVFTYRIPPELREVLQPGHRVRVPFGHRRSAYGYVTGFTSESPPARLRAIRRLEPEEILFTPQTLRLTEWVADYYLAPRGQVMEAALPPLLRRGLPAGASRRRSVTAEAGLSIDRVAVPAGTRPAGQGEAGPEEMLSPHPASGIPSGEIILQPDQVSAARLVAAALEQTGYRGFLLHGVTGSGKTEVYLDAAERVVGMGGGVLFLVPEIAMGTQILSRVLRRFAGRAGLFHSQTGDAERRRIWLEAHAGRLPVVVGTRSAVFVPIPNLRLVVIDEEHEPAYKQEEVPRYHGRDVAVMRARLENAVVLLGSATPSLESLYNARVEKYHLLELPERIDRRPHARITVVDLNAERPPEEAGRGPRGRFPRPIFTPILLRALQERLDRGEQSILFLNRRGHSPVVQCAACGASLQCAHCDVVMTWHKADGVLRCHYCNTTRPAETACGSCGGARFFFGGVGTQKVEETLAEAFPAARLVRMDWDAVRRRGAHGRVVRAMEQGEIDILLGTQMVAKGFHFPRVTLVGVLQADQEMLQPDFRAAERAFQVLTQVAGRSGRGDVVGEVVFQSLQPSHPVILCAAGGDYLGFAEQELRHRQILGYPPFRRMIDILVDGANEDRVRLRSEALREFLIEFLGPAAIGDPARSLGLPEPALRPRSGDVTGDAARPLQAVGRRQIEILGPAPMPHARLKGRHRWHLTLKGGVVTRLHEAVTAALEAPVPPGLSGTRVLVDVDPLGLS